jgi:phospholipid/cholesterol/gamma-HCH transport system substrate-binding protein
VNNKKNMEFIVGGFILVALFILIAGVLWLKSSTIARAMVEYTVLFPDVGMLSQDDPVKVNGVPKGRVKSISLFGSKVKVIIKLDRDIKLTDSCKIAVQNIGLMGERMIAIRLSDKGKEIKPNTKNSVSYINGYFDAGIAEAIGMVGSVLSDVRIVLADVTNIIDSTIGDPSFLKAFDCIVARLDTVTLLAQMLVRENKVKIDKSMTNIRNVTEDIKSLINENKNQISTIISNGTNLTEKALTIAQTLDTITVSLESIVKKIEKGEGSAGMLLADEQFYKDLKKTLTDLDNLLSDVNKDGLKLRLKLGFKKKSETKSQ